MAIEEQFLQYASSKPGIPVFLDKWLERYEQLEYLGGSIVLVDLSNDEKESIAALLQVTLPGGSEWKISFNKVKKALDKSNYEEMDFVKMLELHKGSPFYFKKQNKKQEKESYLSFLEDLLDMYENQPIYSFIEKVVSQPTSFINIFKLWKEDKDTLISLFNAINVLPVFQQKTQLLIEFLENHLKDPHFLDRLAYQNLFISILEHIFGFDEEDEIIKKDFLYYQAGLISNDVSNFVMICHLSAKMEDIHLAWQAMYDLYEPWIIQVYNIRQIKEIIVPKRVYILENPSTFRYLCLHGKQNNMEDCAFICTYGQLNLAAYLLLDILSKTSATIYYAGDFDPEGILIADKLLTRYPTISLWNYETDNYYQHLSSKMISEKRLKMLDKCINDQLLPICDALKQCKYATYQEALHQKYIQKLK
ncbi:TIGR02679 domain-containing protein [Tannockella kyphosi]|uniref:TIGR02679 domain-containing protein n=1 Tax=Tannockella kyphosi TaxID=2899121 RepID=UPI0020117F9C|nr:TIGR02679 domain-containing protein [Tannockella kyphosi]